MFAFNTAVTELLWPSHFRTQKNVSKSIYRTKQFSGAVEALQMTELAAVSLRGTPIQNQPNTDFIMLSYNFVFPLTIILQNQAVCNFSYVYSQVRAVFIRITKEPNVSLKTRVQLDRNA